MQKLPNAVWNRLTLFPVINKNPRRIRIFYAERSINKNPRRIRLFYAEIRYAIVMNYSHALRRNYPTTQNKQILRSRIKQLMC